MLFCREEKEDLNVYQRILAVMTILAVHSVLFYSAHRLFHSSPSWYKHHRFHHRFNKYVSPVAANAVSSVEYIFAYILPFAVSMTVVRPDALSIRFGVGIVSLANVLIHTPKLEKFSNLLPAWVVTAEDHMEHHRKLTTKYAAPTLNVDYLVQLLQGSTTTTSAVTKE